MQSELLKDIELQRKVVEFETPQSVALFAQPGQRSIDAVVYLYPRGTNERLARWCPGPTLGRRPCECRAHAFLPGA